MKLDNMTGNDLENMLRLIDHLIDSGIDRLEDKSLLDGRTEILAAMADRMSAQ